MSSQTPIRSWLFAPGHSEGLLDKVFRAGADAVVLDLEDAVPRAFKAQARSMVAATIRDKSAWVRINVSGSSDAAVDLEAVSEHAEGIRIPKVEVSQRCDLGRAAGATVRACVHHRDGARAYGGRGDRGSPPVPVPDPGNR